MSTGNNKPINFFIKSLSTLLLIAIGFLGGIIYDNSNTVSSFVNGIFSPAKDTGNLSANQVAILRDAAQLVEKEAVNEHKSEDVLNAMLKGLAESLDDPYANYYTKDELAQYNDAANGIMKGRIGVVITKEEDGKPIIITDVYEGSPAERAGLKKLDYIIGVDDTDVSNYATDELSSMIAGDSGTTVSIKVQRGSQQLSFNVTRADFQQKFTTYKIMNNNTMYIKIYRFHDKADEYFKEALDAVKENGCKGIVIDLRDNGGGDVNIFAKIADMLLPEGEIFSARNKKGEKIEVLKSDAQSINLPIAVLINGNSASASEALTGAIRDFGAGKIVGTKSYGKGTMQSSFPLKNEGAFKLTIAKYYLPGGTCIDGVGIIPDYIVELPTEFKDKSYLMSEANDPQLAKALEVVAK